MDLTLRFATITCCYEGCGLTFAVPEPWQADRRNDHSSWFCPNGHSQYFMGESDAEKAKRLADELTRTRAAHDQVVARWRERTDSVAVPDGYARVHRRRPRRPDAGARHRPARHRQERNGGRGMTFLTERQAWTRIAEAFARYETTGKRETLTERGLCRAVSHLGEARPRLCGREMVGPVVFNSMWRKLSDVMDESGLMYLCPCTRRGAGLRAMLATLFAEASQ